MLRTGLITTISLLMVGIGVSGASAATIHNYVSSFKEVPAGGGVALAGPLTGVNAMTVDSGHVWVAEHLEGTSNYRVDKFAAGTGAFVSQFAHAEGSPDYLGVAMGHLAGEGEPQVYLAEADPAAVGVFSEAGVKHASWTGAGTAAGEWAASGAFPNGVAVDNSGSFTDTAAGDVYVPVPSQDVVDVFHPEATGKEAENYVTQLTGTCATPGSCSGEEAFSNPTQVAVNRANGDVIVLDQNKVDLFEPTVLGQYAFVRTLAPPAAITLTAKAVDANGPEGDIYVTGQTEEAGELAGYQVFEFSAAGAYLGHVTKTSHGPFTGTESVAVDPASGDLYVGDSNGETNEGEVDVFGADLVVPDVVTGEAPNPTPGSVTLHGEVNPDNAGEATCQFDYGTIKELKQSVGCSGPVAEGGSLTPVQAPVTGLESDTTYFYRLQATNRNGTNPGEPWQDREFLTPGPGLHGESVANVSASSATFQATINPHNAPTSYYFQYTPTGDFSTATDVPALPGGVLGSGESDVQVPPAHVQGLTAATTYHYRVVAVSDLEGHSQSFFGPDQTFHTQVASTGTALIDGRQWELVSPADKHGARVENISVNRLTQAAANGDGVSYLTNAPTESGPRGYSSLQQVLSTRGAGGTSSWHSQDIATPNNNATGIGTQEYEFFSEDLTSSVLQPVGSFTPLSPQATEQTAYQRNVTTGAAVPLVTSANDTAKPFQPFGEEGKCPEEGKLQCGPTFVGASPDAQHIILQSRATLTSDGAGLPELYEWTAGKLSLVSELPEHHGTPPVEPALGLLNRDVRHAVSDDGSRVVWSEAASFGHLYLRDMSLGETVQLDVVQPGGHPEDTASAQFQGASADGSRVFFTDGARLTANAGREPGINEGDLYECEVLVVGGKLHCVLRDLTPVSGSGERARVFGNLLGASEDGSTVYFVADGVLAPGAAKGTFTRSGKPRDGVANLYVWHEGDIRFIAELSGEDASDWSSTEQVLEWFTARVSSDGGWVAFMSDRDLTGYDTRDAVRSVADEEVYSYDAETGRIYCASCDPTGARPAGVEFGSLEPGIDGGSPFEGARGIAGSVPTWTTSGAATAEARYQPRYLSDSGRVFFNSPGALVPGDVNGTGDVYEFEPEGAGGSEGAGDCSSAASSSPRVVFEPARTTVVEGRDVESGPGCVGLVSSGEGAEEAGFLDASESGGDVFFFTSAKLVGEDVDTSRDVYDAHECTSAAPCFPTAVTQPPPCETGDSCKAAPSPQPASFGNPSSATFSGAGNVGASAPAVKAKAKPPTRAQKLAAALKACRRDRKHARRVSCEGAARRKYKPVKSKQRKR